MSGPFSLGIFACGSGQNESGYDQSLACERICEVEQQLAALKKRNADLEPETLAAEIAERIQRDTTDVSWYPKVLTVAIADILRPYLLTDAEIQRRARLAAKDIAHEPALNEDEPIFDRVHWMTKIIAEAFGGQP